MTSDEQYQIDYCRKMLYGESAADYARTYTYNMYLELTFTITLAHSKNKRNQDLAARGLFLLNKKPRKTLSDEEVSQIIEAEKVCPQFANEYRQKILVKWIKNNKQSILKDWV